MKTIFFGSLSYVLPIINTLKEKSKLKLVITSEIKDNQPVSSYCIQNKINLKQIKKFDNNIYNEIRNIDADYAVLANFGLIIPKELLQIFKFGILNIHPSLLPKYRGPTPGQSAILNADIQTGVSVIKLDDKIDHGPVYLQKSVYIAKDITSDILYTQLFKIGTDLLSEVIDNIKTSDIQLTKQNNLQASYTSILNRESGYINLANPYNTEKIKRMIRAYYPWPGVWTTTKLNHKQIRIKFLPENIQIEGKKPVSLKDFLNGYSDINTDLKKLLTAIYIQ